MKNILFYLSGHGYGHTTRCLEVIKKIQLYSPKIYIHIQTEAPAWLFPLNLEQNYKLIQKTCDIGAVQNNCYDVDPQGTLKKFAKFYSFFPDRIREEVEYIRKNRIDLIVGDIPPLAFCVAREANIPSIGITNFSWDWIYEPYTQNFPEFRWIIERIKDAYNKSNLLLRLPFFGNLSAFPNCLDIPLVARKANISSADVRQRLGIKTNKKIVLVALRKEDLHQVGFDHLSEMSGITFVFFSSVPKFSNFLPIPANFLPFQNLVAASELVVSKPGYGIVSECLANRTPLLYTSRKNFREYRILANGLKNMAIGKLIPRPDFLSGRWQSHIHGLLQTKVNWPDWPLNGAEIAAERILDYF